MTPEPTARSPLVGRLAVIHAAALMLFLAWRFGGMEPLARAIAGWAVLPAPVLTALAWRAAGRDSRRQFRWILVPVLLLAAQVIASAFNPNMRVLKLWGEVGLAARPHLAWLPSSPYPQATLADFGLNLGLLLVALNLMLAHPSRRWLRALASGIALNTAALAATGTLFKLSGATTILGRTPSPNPNFFATFVYHNHWGAMALLGAGAAAGLAFYHNRRRTEGFWQSSAPFWLLVAAVILLAIPLSSGRSSTFAALAFAGACGILLLRDTGRGRLRLAAGLLAAAAAGAVVVFVLAQRTLRNEYAETTRLVSELRQGGIGDARRVIYGDTWRLIRERPWFGWGWESFQYVYPRVQSPIPLMQTQQREQYVLDAHSDWLQLPAEVGVTGTAFVLAALAGWLRWAGPRGWRGPPSREFLLACGALALLAMVDFPAACPAVVLTAACLLAGGAELGRGGSAVEAPAASRP